MTETIPPTPVTLQEAEDIALDVLLRAERRRQEARDAEAEMWRALEDEWNDDTTITSADVA